MNTLLKIEGKTGKYYCCLFLYKKIEIAAKHQYIAHVLGLPALLFKSIVIVSGTA